MAKEYGFENGKYSIIRDDQGDMRAFRNGIHWPTRTVDIIGDKLISSMLNRIDELESVLKEFVDWATDSTGTLALVNDQALWERAENVLINGKA